MKLGRYQVVRHLASGGMAEVLLARASGLEGFTRHVVIKRIRPGQAKDQSFVQMFLNEARLAAQLHHQNIVQVHDIGQEGNDYFFAMEYVHGQDLRHLLTQVTKLKQKVPVEHVVAIISAAASALHHAHEQRGSDRKPLGIVHRDVTPANILVSYDGHVKVVDFGIAKAAAGTHEATQAGTLKGKASYMSPEQCTGNAPVDRRSDVFALGIVLYELVTARRLFKGENDFLTMSAIVGGKVPPATNHRHDLPDALDAIIMKALSLAPSNRYQTADDMREALEQFALNAQLHLSSSSLAAYMKQTFGERPEPWLLSADDAEMELKVDFDGSASGMVRPPTESLENNAIPTSIAAAKSSPIVRARTTAVTGAPPLASVVTPAAKVKTLTKQIPIVHIDAPAEKLKVASRSTVPAAPEPTRKKTKTVQIPAATVAAALHAPKPAEASRRPEHDDDEDAATVVATGVPKDIDMSWDASLPMPVAGTADMIAAEQVTKAATSAASAMSTGASRARSTSSAAGASATAPGPSPSNGANGGANGGGSKDTKPADTKSGETKPVTATRPAESKPPAVARPSDPARGTLGGMVKTPPAGIPSDTRLSPGAFGKAAGAATAPASSTSAYAASAARAGLATTPGSGTSSPAIAVPPSGTSTSSAMAGTSSASKAGTSSASKAGTSSASMAGTSSSSKAGTSSPAIAVPPSGTSTSSASMAGTSSASKAGTSSPAIAVPTSAASSPSGTSTGAKSPAGAASTPASTSSSAGGKPASGALASATFASGAASSSSAAPASTTSASGAASSSTAAPASAASASGAAASGSAAFASAAAPLFGSATTATSQASTSPGPAAGSDAAASKATLPDPPRKAIKLPGMTPSVASDDTRDAIANMLRAPASDDEKTNVADPNDLVTDVAAVGDPHDAVTVTHMVDEPMAESIVTIAEPLPSADIAHASITASRPAMASSPVGLGGGGAPHPAAQASFAHVAAAASEPWLVEAPSAAPARSGLFASRKRLVIAGIGALLLGIVLVAVLAGGGDKPTTAAARGKTGKASKADPTEKVAKADPPKDETPTEPTPTPVEVGSVESQAGSAEAPVVERGTANGSANGSAAAPAPSHKPERVKVTPTPMPVAKKAIKRVAAKPAAKPAAKKPVAKTTTKTATKTSKPAVQKTGAKKPAWDPNSLLPPKKK